MRNGYHIQGRSSMNLCVCIYEYVVLVTGDEELGFYFEEGA